MCHVFALNSLLFLAMKSFLSQVLVKLQKFQLIRCIDFVLCRHNVMLLVFCADKSNNLALFAFLLRHVNASYRLVTVLNRTNKNYGRS